MAKKYELTDCGKFFVAASKLLEIWRKRASELDYGYDQAVKQCHDELLDVLNGRSKD